jgi:hypothetical protein
MSKTCVEYGTDAGGLGALIECRTGGRTGSTPQVPRIDELVVECTIMGS